MTEQDWWTPEQEAACMGVLAQIEAKAQQCFRVRQAALKALRAAEWGGDAGWCPVCVEARDVGHSPDCLIKQALESQA